MVAVTQSTKPKQVQDQYLQNGRILSKKECKEVKKQFIYKKLMRGKNPNRITLYRNREGSINAAERKVTVLKFKKKYFAVYQGENLGKGGIGKVKLMQNIDTGEWMALKVMKVNEDSLSESEQEKDNLIKLERSVGGFAHTEKYNHDLGLISINSNSDIDTNFKSKLKTLAGNKNIPILINENGKISMYQFINNNWKITKLNAKPFQDLPFPKAGEDGSILKSKAITKEMHDVLISKKSHEGLTKKGNYLLAMELAPGIDLNKKFVSTQGKIDVYPSEAQYKYYRDVAKLENDPLFFKALHVFPKTNATDELNVIYFENNSQQENERTLKKEDFNFMDAIQSISHMKHIEKFPVNGSYIPTIFERENNQEFENLLKAMDITQQPTPAPDICNELAKISVGMVQAVKELHNGGLIHRDIKLEQFIYDEENKKIELVDLGSAVEKNAPFEKIMVGTTYSYLPPEILKKERSDTSHIAKQEMHRSWKEGKFTDGKPPSHPDDTFEAFEKFHAAHNKENVNPEYFEAFKKTSNDIRKAMDHIDKASPSLDIYSLGISIGQLFGVVERVNVGVAFKLTGDPRYIGSNLNDPNKQVFVIKDLERAKANNFYHLPEAELGELVDMLAAMTNIDPEKRPTIQEIETFFKIFSQNMSRVVSAEKTASPNDTQPTINTPSVSVVSDTEKPLLSDKSDSTAMSTMAIFKGLDVTTMPIEEEAHIKEEDVRMVVAKPLITASEETHEAKVAVAPRVGKP